MKVISSRQNPAIKKLLHLKNNPEKFVPSYTRLQGEFLIDNPKVIQSAIKAGVKIKTALLTESFVNDTEHTHLINALLEKNVPVNIIDEKLLKKLSDTVTPQGIVVIATGRAYRINEIKQPQWIIPVSDAIQDPGNIGTLIRVADAIGAEYFICIKGSANPFNPKAIRASAGSVFHLKIIFTERSEFLDFLKQNRLILTSTETDGQTGLFQWRPSCPLIIAFGNESTGISDELRSVAQVRLNIPIWGRAESLNVATSAAVVLYEAVRILKATTERKD